MPVAAACQDDHNEARREELSMSTKQRWGYAGLAAMFLIWGLVAGSRGSWLGWLLAGCAVVMWAGLLIMRAESRKPAPQDPPAGPTS